MANWVTMVPRDISQWSTASEAFMAAGVIAAWDPEAVTWEVYLREGDSARGKFAIVCPKRVNVQHGGTLEFNAGLFLHDMGNAQALKMFQAQLEQYPAVG